MVGMSISVVGNDAGVQRMLEALDTALNPIAVAGFLGAVVDPYIRGRAADRFASEGDGASGQWAPLSPATQEIRDQMGYGASHPINRREGELEEFITQRKGGTTVAPYGASIRFPASSPGGELRDKFEHAQAGGVSDSGKSFPARPVLAMDESDLTFVMLSLAEHIERTGKAMI